MDPKLHTISEEGDVLYFTLEGLDVCFSNAIRRTLLSDIPIVVIRTENYDINQCDIHINTGRLHNEILKQRISCIPIHTKRLQDDEDGKALPGNYQLKVHVKNEGDSIQYVTTKDFHLKEKNSSSVLSVSEQDRLFPGLFPMNSLTKSYIDFARLRPKMGDGLDGEEIHLTADFSIACAKDNSMFNVVSKCSYGFTRDDEAATIAWDKQEQKLKKEGETEEDISFQKKNFMILDAQRYFKENSFDFIIQTLGIYENKELIRKACVILQNKFYDFIQSLDSDIVPIQVSETTMENCFDVVLEDEDYTMGRCLEYVIYSKFYEGTKELSFCGFKKFHPHDNNSKLRIAFEKKVDKGTVKEKVRDASVDIQEIFKEIFQMFKE